MWPRGGESIRERRLDVKAEHIKGRLHDAMHRSPKASEEELAAVTAVVLAVVSEVTAELAEVIAELADRVEALEAQVSAA